MMRSMLPHPKAGDVLVLLLALFLVILSGAAALALCSGCLPNDNSGCCPGVPPGGCPGGIWQNEGNTTVCECCLGIAMTCYYCHDTYRMPNGTICVSECYQGKSTGCANGNPCAQ